ncbi:CocE/NonD family hydrolase [Labilithrix luteola]|nr:CocE/NonD family hydrolase [Labilithrix luteola]
MRPFHRLLVGLLSMAPFACGVRTPPAVAEPRRADEPLVASELKDDAELARAIREHYTKYEFRIPMRDGVHLFTAVYAPKERSRTYPILLNRTPYGIGPYGVDNDPDEKNPRVLRRFAPSTRLVREGYIFVHQDVRGRMMSEGTFVDVRPHAQKAGEIDESSDAWDTIDWLVKNVPGNSGRVGIWGVSYPGFYAAQAAVDAHPALKAVSPQAPVTDWFEGDDFHHNGAFFLAAAFEFYSSFGKARPQPTKKVTWGFDHEVADLYDFFLAMGPIANANTKYLKNEVPFWNELFAHGARDDFWKVRNPRPFYKNVKPAVMTVGGWFDAEDCFGALATYSAFEKQSPGASNTLVMGPWRHGGWARTDGDRLGDVRFGQKTSAFYRENIEAPFFQHHLKGTPAPALPEAWTYETGTNVWQHYDVWPPREAKPKALYFQESGGLASAPPARGATGFDEYVSDPKKPVPFSSKLGGEIDEDYMTEDQRFASRRPDVLSYGTGPLAADVTLAGPIEAELWVETTGTDADFVVKLVDVYPEDVADPDPNPTGVKMGGYQQLVRGDVMRGKFRRSFEKPEPFDPGKPALVKFTLTDVNHTFRSGHRIMVQVQSSWFPLVDRNPQTFVDIYTAKESDFKTATHKVLRSGDRASNLRVFVLRGNLP